MDVNVERQWPRRILDFINPLRDPSLTVAAVLTFIEEAGQHDSWLWIILVGLINWLAVRGIVWLVVNFTFASTFISRRVWWTMKHPRLAWRILDAVGHEEIVIGGFSGISEGMLLPNGTTVMGSGQGTGGIQVIGELPAGTEVPLLTMPNGRVAPDFSSLTGALPNLNGYSGQMMNGFQGAQTTDGLPHRSSEEEGRLREQIAAYTRLLDDWMQFTEDKWRTVSDSQLGWKALRGRWSSWDDIFQDAYAAKTSDPMARAAQLAGEATSRRFDSSREKGSAAAAVACFMRDMVTLRRGLDLIQSPSDQQPETPTAQPRVQRSFGADQFTRNSGQLRNGSQSQSPRGPLIRRPAEIFVDADTDK